MRQVVVRGLGREEPTFFLSNDRPVRQTARDQVRVRLSKRAHNPILKAAGLAGPTSAVPWLGGRPVLLDLP